MEAALHCGATAAAGRILRAFRCGDAAAFTLALEGAEQTCAGGRCGSDAEERAELLAAVVDAMRTEPPTFAAGLKLLSHLSGESRRIHRVV